MNPPPTLAEPERRRRRPPVSCTICRKRKIKCNRELPCSNCLRSKNSVCEYVSNSPPPTWRDVMAPGEQSRSSEAGSNPSPVATHARSQGGSSFAPPSQRVSEAGDVLHIPSGPSLSDGFTPPTPASNSSGRDVDILKAKIKHLEDQLSAATQRASSSIPSTPRWDSMTDASQIAGGFHVRREAPLAGLEPTVSRTIMHKTRVVGQSHWMLGVGMFMDILEIVEPILQDANSRALFDLQKCKLLGKFLKTKRTPPWPTMPTTELPPRELADALVDIYLRTSESCYRVLHIPTFRRDYEAVWTQSEPDMAFIIQLKLIFAIAAPAYDDEFSLRNSAIHWVHEAQTYISEPEFKARLTLQYLQTMILDLIAREIMNVEGGLVWISMGSLIRTATYMGLHRDPANLIVRSPFLGEMRRRLWNTVMELALQASMSAGAPPLISLSDFDTNPPANLNDEEIENIESVESKDDQPTQMSIALALRRLFPVRLAIAQSLNGIGKNSTYEETISMEKELRKQYKGICKTMQEFDKKSPFSPSNFQTRALDFHFRRNLLALHIPFFVPSLTQSQYAFSRKVVVDTATQIWATVRPQFGLIPSDPRDSGREDLLRLAKGGHGAFRQVVTSAVFLLAGEFKAQLKEEDSLGPVVLRRDLLDILDDAVEWTWECIATGEMNTKGYLFLALVRAQINGIMSGLSREQFAALYVRTAEEAEERCLTFLESQVGLQQADLRANMKDINDMPGQSFPDMMDFDFSMDNPMLFDLEFMDHNTWLNSAMN